MLRRLLVCCFLTVIAIHCGKTEVRSGLTVTVPPLPDGERNTYRVLVGPDSIGTYTTVLEHSRFKDVPAYMITLVTVTRPGNVTTADSSIVYVTRDSMVPLSSFRFVKTGSALVTTAANYGEASIAVSAYSAGDEKQKLFPCGSNTYDIDQLTFLGRAFDLKPEKPVEIAVMNPMGPPSGGSLRTAKLSYLGEESVTGPAGTFDTRKYGLVMGESTVEFWYDKTGTRKLVRYQSVDSGILMELLLPVLN